MAIGAVGYFLAHEDRFFAISGSPVANVVKTARDVTYRSEDDTRWKRITGSKQGVFDGDRIATGKSSGAVIDFGDGRAANLGEDSSLTLSTIRQSSGLTYILSLPKGSVAIQSIKRTGANAGKVQSPIIIRVAGRDYIIEPGEERGIVRDSGGVREFKGVRRPKSIKEETIPEPLVTPPVAEVIPVALLEEVLPPPPPPPPVEEPKKVVPPPRPREPAVIGTEITPDISELKPEYFTYGSLSAASGDLATVRWTEPKNMPDEWLPAFELTNGTEKKRLLLTKGGSIQLSLAEFGPLKAETVVDGVPCAVLGLRGGAQVKTKRSQRWSFAGSVIETKICSYRDAADNVPHVVGLSSLDGAGEKKGGLFPTPPKASLKYQMIVTTPSQYLALMPLMVSNESLRVAKSQGLSANGIFVAKAGKVIMQIAGSGFDAESANKIRSLVNGDLVFKGSRSSLYDASALSIDELKDWVSKNTVQGKTVFINKSGRLLPINRDFLEERREVAAFVKSLSNQLFTQEVEIVAFK
jgi:hypothetical protein